MKKHLNTLFITRQGAYLHKENESIAVKVDGKDVLKVPIHTIGGIVCFGNVLCSPFLIGHCAECDVSISFLTENGRFLAKVQGPVSGNVLLRREQYRRADNIKETVKITRALLTGKIANCRSVIRRAIRDHADKINKKNLNRVSQRLVYNLERLHKENDLNVLRGIEGESAHEYFSVYNELIIAQKDDFTFSERSRRPPLDRVNALLSFTYTILLHDVQSALETVGLDPAVGYLHRDRPGRPGLALDIMEEFRPYIADRLVLSLINMKQVHKKGFITSETGAVLMDDETRKQLLIVYQKRKQDTILHPFLDEKITVGLLFHAQALLLARYLRGDIDTYPPLICK